MAEVDWFTTRWTGRGIEYAGMMGTGTAIGALLIYVLEFFTDKSLNIETLSYMRNIALIIGVISVPSGFLGHKMHQ